MLIYFLIFLTITIFVIKLYKKYYKKNNIEILPFEKQGVLVVEHHLKDDGSWDVKSYRLPIKEKN